MALVEGGADDWIGTRARSGQTGGGLGAEVYVIAGRAVVLLGIGADTCRWVTHAGYVALIAGGAHDRSRATADTSLAGVGLRAEIGVVAQRPVGHGRVRANSRCQVADACCMALVNRGANKRIRADALARLARVG